MRIKDSENIKELVGWITLSDAAVKMGTSRAYVAQLVAANKIPTLRRVGSVLVIRETEAMVFKRKSPPRLVKN